MKGFREIMKMIVGNIALVQVQAIVAATLVAFFATIVGLALDGKFQWDHTLLLVASSVSTATSSCFILGKTNIYLKLPQIRIQNFSNN